MCMYHRKNGLTQICSTFADGILDSDGVQCLFHFSDATGKNHLPKDSVLYLKRKTDTVLCQVELHHSRSTRLKRENKKQETKTEGKTRFRSKPKELSES